MNYSLATYGQVRNSLPDAKIMDSLHDLYADDRDTLRREFKKKAQLLLRIKWFRVILDEGHGITRWNGRSKSKIFIRVRDPFL